MKGLSKILLEGRIEDAERYIHNSVGLMSDESQEIFQNFVDSDPSGSQKYLMWMVKIYDREGNSTNPNDITSLVQRFHKNVDRLTIAFIMNMDIFDPSGKIATSPKNIDSYDDLEQLERVMDEMDTITTKKEKEKEAKSGVDKLYEDDRWLLVRPNTYEGSCYYGSATKWCTASKDAPQHFEDYSKTGNLFYIIDKSKDVGDFFKIALHKKWDGEEAWYDRADNEIEEQTEEAIRSLLPTGLVRALEVEHNETKEKGIEPLSLGEFKRKLDDYITSTGGISYSTQTGNWKLEIRNGKWEWEGVDPRIEVYATPFFNGDPGVDVHVITDDDDLGQPAVEYNEYVELDDLHNDWLGPNNEYQINYLSRDGAGTYHRFGMEQHFIRIIYMPILTDVLNSVEVKEYTNLDYKTWDTQSYVSSYTFKYPPKQGTMTQKFVDYLKELYPQKRTANQFYEDVLGYARPRAHNNMFFASIKDSGIVKMERSGRQFVYSLGPNHKAWTQGRLLRKGRAYGQPG
jgi:hypothetical protein